MIPFLVRRLILTAVAVFGVLTVTFMVSHLLPADPARALAGRWATESQIEAIRAKLGLNKPIPTQFARYLTELIHGNLGTSIVSERPITTELGNYLPPTLELVLAAMVINIALGVPLGVLSALRRGGVVDMFSRLIAIMGAAAPAFWVGLLLQMGVYGSLHGLLPLGGQLSYLLSPPAHITGSYVLDSLLTSHWTTFGDALIHLILPAITLGLGFVAVTTRIVRSSMLTALNTDYVQTARAKGLPGRVVVYKHAFKNAILPPLTVMGMQLGWMMGGTVLVESIFSWGGIGFWAVTSIQQNDFPVIMAVTLITSLTFILANFCVDLLSIRLDPRIRYS